MSKPNHSIKNHSHSAFDVGFGIYVHWPFCLAKCPYCDFNSHVRHGGIDEQKFVDGLKTELKHFASRTPERKVTSIFFGGGTPSLMSPHAVAQIIDQIALLWNVAGDVEITLEANPTSIEAQNFIGYRAGGVNRVSVGIQSLNDQQLKALGRQHTAKEALEAFTLAKNTFEHTSFDLIYTRPDQSVEDWESELSQALAHQQGHMSLYQLTIEPDTAFEKLHRAGKLIVPDDDIAANLFDVTQELTDKAGLNAYEISNHAYAGQESRHNKLYWRYGEYVGVGAGAHSRIIENGQRLALNNEKIPEHWLDTIAKNGCGTVETEVLTIHDEAKEFLLMGLRLNEGIDLERYSQLFNATPAQENIDMLIEQNLLEKMPDSSIIRATNRGKTVLNGLISYLAD